MCKIKHISWSEAYRRLMEDGKRTGAGFMVMYRGLGAHTLGALKPAFQYAIYEQLKKRTLAGQTAQALSALQAFNLGAAARATADCICYPARTAKTRKQSALNPKNASIEQKALAEKMQSMGSIEVLQHVVSTEGIMAVYRGIEMEVLILITHSHIQAVLRTACHVASCTFDSELALAQCTQYHQNKLSHTFDLRTFDPSTPSHTLPHTTPTPYLPTLIAGGPWCIFSRPHAHGQGET
jgi:hypothetical protein